MAHIRIEMDRGNGWELRSEGDVDATPERAAAEMRLYAYSAYAHRILHDGEVVATKPAKGRRNERR